jgi:hypothetical protein
MPVVPLNGFHQGKQDRHRDDHQVRAVGELGSQDHNQDQPGEERSTRIDQPRSAQPVSGFRRRAA